MKRKIQYQFILLFAFFQSFAQNSNFFKESNKHFKDDILKTDQKGWIKFKDESKLLKGQAFKKYNSNKQSKDEFKEISTKKDKAGNEHIRYQQYYNGLIVECGVLIEHLKNNKLKTLNGVYLEDIKSSIHPKLTKDEAIKIALKDIGEQAFVWQDSIAEAELKKDSENQMATFYPKPELFIDCNRNLVYKFNVPTSNDNLEYRINAITGIIETKMSKILRCGHDNELNNVKHLCNNSGCHSNDNAIGFKIKSPSKLLTDLTTYGSTLFSGVQPIRTTWNASCWFCSSKHRLIANNYSSKIETRDHQLSTNLNDWRREVTMNGISNTAWPIAEQLHTQTHWAVTRSYDYFSNIHGLSVGAGNGTIRAKSNVNDPNARYLGDNRSLTFGFLNGNYLGTMDVYNTPHNLDNSLVKI
jgi:hypothetical protein